MDLNVEGEDGTKLELNSFAKTLIGRGLGFTTNDLTVSRRHIQFQPTNSAEKSDAKENPRVSFEIIGRNPVWVVGNKDGEIRVFRRLEKAEIEVGDRFCLSGKEPVWFDLKCEGRKGSLGIENEVCEISSDDGVEIERVDVSGIDPVKEFGFVLMGHEFDNYPKGMILNVKNWNWFLEEPNKDDDEDGDDFGEKRAAIGRKRKKGKVNKEEDDDWTGESEDDTKLLASRGKVRISGYSTRSRDRNKQIKYRKGSKSSGQKKAPRVNETVEDEEDETLGGFIVDDEEDDLEEENSEEGEEEEFEEDEMED